MDIVENCQNFKKNATQIIIFLPHYIWRKITRDQSEGRLQSKYCRTVTTQKSVENSSRKVYNWLTELNCIPLDLRYDSVAAQALSSETCFVKCYRQSTSLYVVFFKKNATFPIKFTGKINSKGES